MVLALSIYIALAVCRPPSACPKCSNMTYPHFTDGRTEAQRGQVTCPRPRSQRVEAEQESELFSGYTSPAKNKPKKKAYAIQKTTSHQTYPILKRKYILVKN